MFWVGGCAVVVGLRLWVGGCAVVVGMRFAMCGFVFGWVWWFAVVVVAGVGDRFGSGFAVHFGLGLMVVTGFG